MSVVNIMEMKSNKVCTLKEAIAKYIMPGTSVFFAGMQHGEPSAAIHEIVRQKIGGLTVIPVLTHTAALLFGEGLVEKFITAYIGDLYYRYSCVSGRAIRRGRYPILEEMSHHGLAVALYAGSCGIPFMTTRAQLGTDIIVNNPNLKVITCPFTGVKLLAVKAITPDVGIIHVQRCDAFGNAQKWGSMGMDEMGINACKKIIITTEEIVDHETIRLDPNRTIIPGFRVDAVVEAKWGAYPLHLAGCYDSDLPYFSMIMSDERKYDEYVEKYIYSVKDHKEMMDRFLNDKGKDWFDRLKLRTAGNMPAAADI